jgi:glycosyltransferase involved in cell wall biosynthesis
MTGVTPRVTVVVPVYNALPYLRECLWSLAVQDLDPRSYEVIAVDDGSTDGSAAVLDEHAVRHPNVRVIHRPNSGGPGGPRNAGLALSSATYVFFADADDLVAPESLRRLIAFADDHGSDVVIPRLAGLGGRRFPTSVYKRTVVDADRPTAFGSLFPQKLYRRALLADRGIRFPEGRVRWEDGIFNARVYIHAKRISILADYDYYHLRARDDGGNLSGETLEPITYTRTVTDICRIVREHLGDSDEADRIVLDLYARKCLHIYHGTRFARLDETTRDAWIAVHQRFAAEYITPAMERELASPLRERAYYLRRGDAAGLLSLSQHASAPVLAGALVRAGWNGDDLEVAIDVTVHGRIELPPQIVCELRHRDGDGASAFPLVRRESVRPEGARYAGTLPAPSIAALLRGRYDAYIVSVSGRERLMGRVGWGAQAVEPQARAAFRVHPTKGGHVAIDARAEREGVDVRLRSAFGRVASTLRFRG